MIKKIQKSNKKSIKLLNKAEFRSPYQIIMDETFITNMNKYGKRYKHMTEIFKSEPKLFFTKCICNKYKNTNPNFENDISDNCEMIVCKHKNKSDVQKCLAFVFRRFNKNHYIVATSSKDIMDKYRDRADIPLLNFTKGQIRLFVNTENIKQNSEHITEASTKEIERLEQIFGKDEISLEPIEEFEEVDINELEVSEDFSNEDQLID
jgi:U3 small nucleolar RNA-associated protein 23